MRRIEYPFYTLAWGNNTTRVYLPVRLTNPETGQMTDIEMALLDTGADASAIPGSLACSLGHNLKHKDVRLNATSGISGEQVDTYGHTFRVELLSADAQRVVWSSEQVLMECIDKEIPILLGAKDFLTNFRITIDYPAQKVILQWEPSIS
jgi:predicted aspartyl protease